MAAKTNCPRCSQPFACTPYSGDCWCFSISISAEIKEVISQQYDDCLCEKCLQEIAESLKPKPTEPDPDFYYENGFMVLTRSYHLKRGYCCGNGCRHCPYPKEVPA